MFGPTETVTRLRAARVTDPYSSESTKLDWSSTTSATFSALVADSGSVEQIIDGRTPVDSDFTLYSDESPDVTPQDRVVVRGLTCNVTGRPFTWGTSGTVVQAKIREG